MSEDERITVMRRFIVEAGSVGGVPEYAVSIAALDSLAAALQRLVEAAQAVAQSFEDFGNVYPVVVTRLSAALRQFEESP